MYSFKVKNVYLFIPIVRCCLTRNMIKSAPVVISRKQAALRIHSPLEIKDTSSKRSVINSSEEGLHHVCRKGNIEEINVVEMGRGFPPDDVLKPSYSDSDKA